MPYCCNVESMTYRLLHHSPMGNFPHPSAQFYARLSLINESKGKIASGEFSLLIADYSPLPITDPPKGGYCRRPSSSSFGRRLAVVGRAGLDTKYPPAFNHTNTQRRRWILCIHTRKWSNVRAVAGREGWRCRRRELAAARRGIGSEGRQNCRSNGQAGI